MKHSLILLLFLPYAQSITQTADIHVSAASASEGCALLPDARFVCRGVTMLTLVATAYSVDANFVIGGPDWLDSDRFDVSAKVSLASPEALPPMLQLLLADRFGLAVHRERKAMPAYFLTLNKKGPKLKPAAHPGAADCPIVDGPPGMNHRACRAFTMADLSELLPQVARNYVDHPVVDKTGIAGSYDFPLDWMGKAAYLAAKANPDGPVAVSMFDAIEKLGLKLEPGKSPASVIVIDRVNRVPADAASDAEKNPPIPTAFEAAEVRQAKPGVSRSLIAQNGRLEILGYTLKELIAMAFEVKDDKVMGGPEWLDADRFDVIAKSPEVMSPHVMTGMLKSLIVQRFKVETHNEARPVPVFALVSGKGSPKLKQADGSVRSECTLTLVMTGRAYACRNTTMAQLVERLPEVAQAYITHPLVDLTGLKGAYDFTLTWTAKSRLPGQPTGEPTQASTPSGDLTVFEAIAKQLGLKLEERTHPMPVIVIDRADRTPAGNL